LEHVIETMRPLPIEQVAGAPSFVRGLAIIRGAPIPVVDAARLLEAEGPPGTEAARFVTLNAGGRQVALVVDAVIGIRSISFESLQQLPPLLKDAGADTISAIGTLDAELLFILRTSRLAPDDSWFVAAGKESPA
jgi:purine-binding chemotaxis protein CheW